jgi:ParB family chromosome partitioning protein
LPERTALDAAISAAQGETSVKRFDAVFAARAPSRPPPAPKSQIALRGSDGKAIGVAKQSKGKTVLTLDAKSSAGFETWLVENISELHARWKQSDGP